jgi:4-amino-4-deoxy-L-arabinose transferase-like glycosyltransferase
MENNIDQNIQSPVPPQEGTMPPFAPMPPHAPKPMRQRMMNRMGALKDAFPKWLSQYSIVVYILALAVVSFMYSSHSLPWYYMLSGVVAVIVFFLYGGSVTKETSIEKIRKSQRFERRIFFIAFIPRVVFMLLLYQIFMANYGDSLGFENMDALYYDELGTYVAGLIKKGNFHFYDEISSWSGSSDVADMGYGVYVGFIYWLTGNSIIVVRLLKCLLSSITVLLVYRLAKRNFGDQTARVAAIFCALWPNFWYYCAIHLKETEMVFLAVLFVEQADQMLRSKQFTAWKVIPVLLIAATIFTFRTPLGVVSLLALIFSVIMSSTRVVSWGKRIIVGLLAVLLIGVTAGNRIQEQSQALYEQARGGVQQENMEWRTKRDNGNAFAKYAGKTVFAPLIFTIPFPSMVRPYDGQDVQQINNGGNFVKNIVSCFTIFAMIMLLMSGKWREHILPLSFVLGYLVVLTMSMFAQSERFHQPIMPFEFMFAAYGLSIAVTKPKYKRWFTYWCALIFVACIVWNWFKMAGRGLA